MATVDAPKGGYDCDFVNVPPKSLECSICLLTVRDPHVISCCGNQFCRPCIQRVKQDRKPCPLCKEPNFTTFLHKGIVREVNSLLIRCPQKNFGCSWVGELGQLNSQHLNPVAKPGGVSRDIGCGYVMVECAYQCGERFPRTLVHQHEVEVCPRRPLEIQVSVLSKKLEDLVAENRFLKNEIGGKLDAVIKSNQDIRAKNEAIEAENKILKDRISELEPLVERVSLAQGMISVPTPTPPFYIRIYNFDHYKTVHYRWCSECFYSHPGGYKMKLQLYPDGNEAGYGNSLSVYVHIMRGEFDEALDWPFAGTVTLQMYNRKTQEWDSDLVIELEKGNVNCERPIDCACNNGIGKSKWISHSELFQTYGGKGRNVRFRVKEVTRL